MLYNFVCTSNDSKGLNFDKWNSNNRNYGPENWPETGFFILSGRKLLYKWIYFFVPYRVPDHQRKAGIDFGLLLFELFYKEGPKMCHVHVQALL